MIQMATRSMAGQPPRMTIEHWSDIAAAANEPLVRSSPDTYRKKGADVGRARQGPVRIAEVCSDPQVVRHDGTPVSSSGKPIHFLHLQLEGLSLNRQDRREALLEPGDLTICDNSRPYEIRFDKPSRMLVLGVPDKLMRRYLQYPQSITALPISGREGTGGLVSDLLQSIWRRCRDDENFVIDAGITDAVLGLVAHAYRQKLGSSIDHNSLGAAHRVRILDHIEENLSDPNLTPTQIAKTFGITTRYLHHLFSEEKETIARYILRRRLENCARALTAPSLRRRTITSIAFDNGFSSATHFGRVFRSRHKLTPREYRRRNSMDN